MVGTPLSEFVKLNASLQSACLPKVKQSLIPRPFVFFDHERICTDQDAVSSSVAIRIEHSVNKYINYPGVTDITVFNEHSNG